MDGNKTEASGSSKGKIFRGAEAISVIAERFSHDLHDMAEYVTLTEGVDAMEPFETLVFIGTTCKILTYAITHTGIDMIGVRDESTSDDASFEIMDLSRIHEEADE